MMKGGARAEGPGFRVSELFVISGFSDMTELQ
jgi:hypothetical protein